MTMGSHQRKKNKKDGCHILILLSYHKLHLPKVVLKPLEEEDEELHNLKD
jgi:hypothetical protein